MEFPQIKSKKLSFQKGNLPTKRSFFLNGVEINEYRRVLQKISRK